LFFPVSSWFKKVRLIPDQYIKPAFRSNSGFLAHGAKVLQ
jgi:hypothetical protein